MPIRVTCPGCHKRFHVSEKFAGKSGPCPNCKAVIRVPTEDEEVKVETPTEFVRGGRAVTGELLTKPIARKEAKITPVMAVAVGGAVLVVFLATWALGKAGFFENSLLISGAGLLLASPPLVVAGYSFLRDPEDLEPLHGMGLYIRSGICSVVYVGLWAVFGYVADYALTGELWNWLYVAPPFFVVGALAALACLDLDFGSGFFHYCFYLSVTVLLRWLAGLGWVWEFVEQPPY